MISMNTETTYTIYFYFKTSFSLCVNYKNILKIKILWPASIRVMFFCCNSKPFNQKTGD